MSDAALSASKVAGGVIADKPGVERKAVTAGGYAITAVGHGAFALANAWPVLAVARAVSWIARGGKGPSRDSLLSGSVPEHQLGRAFGLERSMDSVGAILGPLMAAPLIVAVGYRWLFAISIIPGLLAALAVILLVRETPRIVHAATHLPSSMGALLRTPGPFRRLLAGVGLYGLGNFSATLLILRATELLHSNGRSSGRSGDRSVALCRAQRVEQRVCVSGRRARRSLGTSPRARRRHRPLRGGVRRLHPGIAVDPGACVLFVAVGASTALVDTGEGSHAAELLHDSVRGRGFGLLGLVDGIGDLLSSVIVGALFTVADPAWGFVYGAVMATAAVAVLSRPGALVRNRAAA